MIQTSPQLVDGEAHGRLGMSAVLHSVNGTTDLILKILVVLGLIVVTVAIADLMSRGRFTNTAFMLTDLATPLAPLLGVFAAANALLFAFMDIAERNIAAPTLITIPLAEGALAIAFGSFVGGTAVVLKAILRLAKFWSKPAL